MIYYRSILSILRSDGLYVIRGHVQWIIAQKDSSILFVFQLFTNTLNLIILVRSSNSIAVLILIRCQGLHCFIPLRWLWIARIRPAFLFISDHFMYISKSYNLLIVQNILKVCSTCQTDLSILKFSMIWLLFIIKLRLILFAGRGEKYLLERVLSVTSGCHISLVIVSHRLCRKVIFIWKTLLLSFLIPWMNRGMSVVAYYFWIFFLMIWNHNYLILVCVSHWFMEITN